MHGRSSSPFRRLPRIARDLRGPLAVAFALRFLLLALAPSEPSWDGVIYARAAEQLARGEGYTLRILAEANPPVPTAYYPVGFPALLALVRLLGGGLLADRALQIAATTLLVPLSYLFARRAAGYAAGRWAAWLAACWPGGVFLSATWLAEPVFAVGLSLSLLPLLYARRARRLRALVITSFGLGLVAYVRPSALPIAAALGLGLGALWARRRNVRQRAACALGCAALTTALACVPLAPWALRNQQRLGAPVLVSTNGGVNLYLGSLGPGWYMSLHDRDPCERPARSEVARDRCYSELARSMIVRDPLDAVGRALLKLAHTFGHELAPGECFVDGLQVESITRSNVRLGAFVVCGMGWMVLLIAGLRGARALSRGGPSRMAVLLFSPIAALAALHMVYVGGDRYHAAVAPMVMALGGVAIARRRRAAATLRSDTVRPEGADPASPSLT